MTLPKMNINLRQHGMLRIEITAIVMLLSALAILLVENLLLEHQADIAPTGVAVQALPATNIDAEALVDGALGDIALGNDKQSLLPAAWQASETP
jgi:hypothetical protein